jgi:hypothetical protein
LNRWLAVLILLCFGLAACGRTLVQMQESPTPAIRQDSHAAQPTQTATPTPVGTWVMVISGTVYNTSTDDQIAGASIRYVVVASWYPEIQAGWPNTTTADEHGEFSLPMIVHDTDTIKIVVEAQGFILYEANFNLFGDRNLNIGLTPELTEPSLGFACLRFTGGRILNSVDY